MTIPKKKQAKKVNPNTPNTARYRAAIAESVGNLTEQLLARKAKANRAPLRYCFLTPKIWIESWSRIRYPVPNGSGFATPDRYTR